MYLRFQQNVRDFSRNARLFDQNAWDSKYLRIFTWFSRISTEINENIDPRFLNKIFENFNQNLDLEQLFEIWIDIVEGEFAKYRCIRLKYPPSPKKIGS